MTESPANEAAEGFYASYNRFKDYSPPRLAKKHIRRYDEEVWEPGAFENDMSVLEIGCGGGSFLLYLKHKGVTDFLGMDQDAMLRECMPESLRPHFEVADAFAHLSESGRTYDRVVMFDVLEHFSPDEATRLISAIRAQLEPGGRIILRVPNAGSPWGLQYQYGDLTHCTGYTPNSLRQLAIASGFRCHCHPQRTGKRVRRFMDGLFHGFLDRVLVSPPEIWAPNIYAVLTTADP